MPTFTPMLESGSNFATSTVGATEILDSETARFELEARRCKSITNYANGRTYERNLDPACRWATLYRRCVNENRRSDPGRPLPWTLEMEAVEEAFYEFEGENGSEKYPRLTFEELNSKPMPRLREIGLLYGVKGTSKPGLIKLILDKQTDIINKTANASKG